MANFALRHILKLFASKISTCPPPLPAKKKKDAGKGGLGALSGCGKCHKIGPFLLFPMQFWKQPALEWPLKQAAHMAKATMPLWPVHPWMLVPPQFDSIKNKLAWPDCMKKKGCSQTGFLFSDFSTLSGIHLSRLPQNTAIWLIIPQHVTHFFPPYLFNPLSKITCRRIFISHEKNTTFCLT